MFSFCRPVSSRKRFLPQRRINNEFSFTLFDSAGAINADEWRSVTGETVFLDPSYLQVTEKCVHTRLQSRYVLVYQRGIPCGVIYYQVVDFNAGLFGNLITRQIDNIKSRRFNLFERYLDANREEVLLRLFTCGNNLVSGEHGFVFDKNLRREKSHELLLTITDVVAREEKLRGTIAAILLKDFGTPLKPEKLFERESYSKFSVEPNMVVDIPPNVSSLEDYISLFSKKYRNRARSIQKKGAEIEKRPMDVSLIEELQILIYGLYAAVFEKAKFRLMQLPGTYFTEVKKIFPRRFFVNGYFISGELVAFNSFFVMPDGTLEAHYIGIDYTRNEQFDLYQNILLDLIRAATVHNCSRVNLGRTAAEIKSTVGARAQDLYCYIKPQNTISRLIQRPFISFLQPAPWTARNPFREESAPRAGVEAR